MIKKHLQTKKQEILQKLLGLGSVSVSETDINFRSPDRPYKSTTAPYEKGMHVGYEAFSKKVSVYFRGQRKVLHTLYDTREEGILAGEQLCRENGWQG